MGKRALIVGAAGQDGRLLGQLLANKGYDVYGLTRTELLSPANERLLSNCDITDGNAAFDLIQSLEPHEIYYLAAHHHSSEELPDQNVQLLQQSLRVNTEGIGNVLEAARSRAQNARIFYAASSHIFGSAGGDLKNEASPISPETVYGITKAAGVFLCRHYRKTFSSRVSVGILFNHESVLRNPKFLSKRIAKGVASIKRGQAKRLIIGDLDAQSDWGYAPDFVAAMHQILQLDEADDFVIATGKKRTVRDFVSAAFSVVGLDYVDYVEVDPALLGRAVKGGAGDPTKLASATGWSPAVSFEAMVTKLVRQELECVQTDS